MPLLAVGLSACQHGPYTEDSPYYDVPPGSTFVLNEPLKISANRATVRIQAGEILPPPEVERRYPHCILETWSVSENPRTLQPDSFTITRMERDVTTFAGISKPFLLAQAGSNGGDGPSELYYQSIFYLSSMNQPDVYSLTCQVDQVDNTIETYLTLDEIRQALGGLMTLTLNR